MPRVDIRYNTSFPSKSRYQWRVIVDGLEHLVNAVRCETPTYTTSDFIEGEGMKFHMTTDANIIDFDFGINGKTALIK